MSVQASSGIWREYSQKPEIALHLVEKQNVSNKDEKFTPILCIIAPQPGRDKPGTGNNPTDAKP